MKKNDSPKWMNDDFFAYARRQRANGIFQVNNVDQQNLKFISNC